MKRIIWSTVVILLSIYNLNAQVKDEEEASPDDTIDYELVVNTDDENRVRKYPSRLWEITKNGVKKPSYLYGTMHVSKKLAFNLGDTFYKAIASSDVVALELAIDSWFSNIGKNSKKNNNKRYEDDYSEMSYKSALRFKKSELDKIVYAMSAKDYMSSFLLYREEYNEDFAEKTYVDLYIHQLGKKMGKSCEGVEEFEVADRMTGRADWQNRVVNAKNNNRRYRNNYYDENPIEKAYRDGDLDLIDSLDRKSNPNKLSNKWMLDERNRVMANSIHKNIMNGKSIFAAVGCAHLPADSGVIEMLRGMGYTLKPIKDKIGDYAFEQKRKYENQEYPIALQKFYSLEGDLEIDLPGKPILRNEGENEEIFYADVSNGAYYVTQKIYYNGFINKVSPNKIIERIDSALYENIPGDILTKEKVDLNGYPAFFVSNRTKSGETQRHVFIALENYIWYTKVNASSDYAFSKDVTKILKSIKINSKTTSWNTYSPEFGGFSINWPTKTDLNPISFDTSTNYKLFRNLYHTSKDEFYFLKRIESFNQDKMGDSFHFPEMVKNLAYYDKYTIEKANFEKVNGRLVYKAFLKSNTGGKNLSLILAPEKSNYYYIGVFTSDKDAADKLINSFKYEDFKYKYLPTNYTDVESKVTYKTTNTSLFNYWNTYLKEEREIMKKDIVYPVKYTSAAYYWQDSLNDGKSIKDRISFPSEETLDISYYGDSKLAPIQYNTMLNNIVKRKGTLQTNFKKYKDSLKTAAKIENAKYNNDKDTVTYKVGELEKVLIDTIYKNGDFFVREFASFQKGSNVVNVNKIVTAKHQEVEFDYSYDRFRGPSKIILEAINSFKIPTDNENRLDSNSVAKLLLNLMNSKDSVDKFKLTDYLGRINTVPSKYNKEIFAQLQKYAKLNLPEDEEIEEALEAKLLDNKYEGMLSYFVKKYAEAGDTTELQAKYLGKIAELKTKKAMDTLVYFLLEETPLKPENSYDQSVFSDIINVSSDTLKLWKDYFTKLLPLKRYNEYNSAIFKLGNTLLDSQLIQKSVFEPYLDDLSLTFRDNLKRKAAARKSNSYDYENEDAKKYESKDYTSAEYNDKRNYLFENIINYEGDNRYNSEYDEEAIPADYAENLSKYKNINSFSNIQAFNNTNRRYNRYKKSNDLLSDAKLLMLYYKTNSQVQKRVNKVYKIQNLYEKLEFIKVLAEGGAIIPDSINKIYLNKIDYKFGYSKLLLENKKPSLVSPDIFKKDNYINAFAYYTRWNNSDSVVNLGTKNINIANEKGTMYFYKHKTKIRNGDEPIEWSFAYLWVGDKDNMAKLAIPRYYEFDKVIPKKLTINELINTEVDALKNWEHPNWMPLIPEDEKAEKSRNRNYY